MSDKKSKLSKKTKFLNAITFGYLKRKALNSNTKEQNSQNLDLQNFYEIIGEVKNLQSIQLVSNNSIKIFLNDINKVNVEDLKNYLNAIGFLKSNNAITIISKLSKELYEEYLSQNEK